MEAPSGDGWRANQLANAAARGDLETAARLLDGGADPNAANVFGRTPIQDAEEVLQMSPLDKYPLEPTVGRAFQLQAPCSSSEEPPGFQQIGLSMFDKVVMKLGNPKVAELLLERRADPNVPDPSTGSLPVHDAAREGFLDTLQVLISGGARLDLPNNYGRLPLDEAAENGQNHTVRFLALRQRDNA